MCTQPVALVSMIFVILVRWGALATYCPAGTVKAFWCNFQFYVFGLVTMVSVLSALILRCG